MQYMWQHRLWQPAALATVDGEPVEVLDPGLPNTDAGPDFFNAKLRIDKRVWAGNVEIHLRASDWHRHGHDNDRAYDSVVLHVVAHDDARIRRPDGREIAQVVLGGVDDFCRLHSEMTSAPHEPACRDGLPDIPQLHVSDWLTALAFERIYAKAAHFGELVERCDGDWHAGLYVLLARALGFSTNNEPFERLAAATPLRCLMRHQGNTRSIEGALFGQAGLLDPPCDDGAVAAYMAALRREYEFMKAKYGFTAPAGLPWKMARMRPQNFPHRRIAFLAAMVSGGFAIASTLPSVRTLADAMSLFGVKPSEFWDTHYSFAPSDARAGLKMGRRAIESLIINVVVPALYYHGTRYGGDNMDACIELLQSLPAEDNRLVRLFTDAGIKCPDAFTSQAIIQLRRAYCEPRKCIYCRFGHRILAGRMPRR